MKKITDHPKMKSNGIYSEIDFEKWNFETRLELTFSIR